MIKKILFPTDFSACANNALKFAGNLAARLGAELTISHIYTVPVVDVSVHPGAIETIMTEMETAARENMKKTLARFQKAYPQVAVKTKTKTGFPVSEIISQAKKGKADLVIMGTTGASGMDELLVGSNAASVLEKAECPVLAIPEKSRSTTVTNILYTTDLTMPEGRTFSKLLDFARTLNANITVLHVQNENDRYFKLSEIRFENYGKMVGYNKVKYDEVKSEKTFDAINKYINSGNFDMVAMATHSRGFFDKLFHRSLTKRMAYHTKIPLLSFRKD